MKKFLKPFRLVLRFRWLCLFGDLHRAQDSSNSLTPTCEAGSADPKDMTSGDYRIAPRDQLQINVFQVPDLNRAVLVNGAGFVVLPLVGNVHVAGKTTDQAQQEIAAKLGKTYLRSPQVSVAVTKSGQRVTINGAVKQPQVITIDGRLTLAQAIASTGGLSELANAQRVHVARVVGQESKITFSMSTPSKLATPRIHRSWAVTLLSSKNQTRR